MCYSKSSTCQDSTQHGDDFSLEESFVGSDFKLNPWVCLNCFALGFFLLLHPVVQP